MSFGQNDAQQKKKKKTEIWEPKNDNDIHISLVYLIQYC